LGKLVVVVRYDKMLGLLSDQQAAAEENKEE